MGIVGGPYGVSLRKLIRSGWGNFSRFITFKVGSVTNICFWHDLWCGYVILKVASMDLHRVGQTKEAFITDYRNTIDWDIAFIRDVHDWNLGVLSPFLNFILAHAL